jgi:hypothetical protein
MPDLFKEIIPSITQTKQNVFEDGDLKDYNAFMVNRALSLHMDCILQAAEMNRLHDLPKDMQYAYLMVKVRPRKRPFVPWSKKDNSMEVKAISWFFDYNDSKSLVALGILTEEQITNIMAQYKDNHKT